MGAAVDYDIPDAPLETPPMLTKLYKYCYSPDEQLDSPTNMSTMLEGMDTKALAFMQRLVNDLANLTYDSQILKTTVRDLTEELDREKQKILDLKSENSRFNDENRRLLNQIKDLESKMLLIGTPGTSPRDSMEDEQLLQWRAQSIHQLQELERMNQALRTALSRHTCMPPAVSPTSDDEASQAGGASIVMSQVLAPSALSASGSDTETLGKEDNMHRFLSDVEGPDHLEHRHSDLQKELIFTKEELSAKKKEIEKLSALVDVSTNLVGNHKSESKSLRSEENTSSSQKMEFESEIERINASLNEQESLVHSLRAQLEQKSEQLSFIIDEKAVVEEALNSSQAECSQLSSLIKEYDEKMKQLQGVVSARTHERDSALSKGKQDSDERQDLEIDLHNKCDHLLMELKTLQGKELELQQERDELKKKEEMERSKHAEVLNELMKCQKQLECAQKDTEDLKSLVTQLDSTREELLGKLKMAIADRHVSENQVKSLEMELYRVTEEADIRNSELADVHKVLENLSKEHANLQAEMEMKADKLSKFSEEKDKLITEAKELKKKLGFAEQKIHDESLVSQERESEMSTLKDRLCMEENAKKAAEDRCAIKGDELEALAEHLTTMTCDFQIMKAEFMQVVSERENMVEDIKSLTSRLSYCQQVISAKEEEEKSITNSYNQLAEEHQQLKLAAIELDAQAQQQLYQLQNMESVIQSTQERLKASEEECQKLRIETKEMEKQMDNLTRSLNQRASIVETLQKEKAALISQLSSTKQMSLEIEEKNSTLMRELAASESNNQLLLGMVQGKIQEVESFAAKYRMEHERVRELDQLLACFRAQEHQMQIESKDASAKVAIMKERLVTLEEQVRLLQKNKESQREEMHRLNGLLKEKSEENRKMNSLRSDSHSYNGTAESQTKLQELELKTLSLAADLSKTESLYKDCLWRLQRAETQCAEQRCEYDHVLSILSKVDDDRLQFQQRCRQLVSVASLKDNSKLSFAVNGKLERIVEQPETESSEDGSHIRSS